MVFSVQTLFLSFTLNLPVTCAAVKRKFPEALFEREIKVQFPNRQPALHADHLTPRIRKLRIRFLKEIKFKDFSFKALTFPSPVKSGFPENDLVWCELFEPPSDQKGPSVVVLHFLKDPQFLVTRYVCRYLATNGISALLVKLPYYGERKPPGLREGNLSTDLEGLVKAWRQGILDTRCALAFLSSLKRSDKERTGLVGVSLGALLGATVTAVDARIKRAVLVLGGGNLAHILWTAPEAKELREELRKRGVDEKEAAKILEPIEPLGFARPLPEGTALMINASKDKTVPPCCTKALSKAFGGVPVLWYPTGHTGLAAYMEEVLKKTAEFLKKPR